MDPEDRLAYWRERHAEATSGWDFSAIDAVVDGEPPWSYDALAREVLTGAASALDLGTGGGELLLTLVDALPADTVATEGWPPNVPVATEALAPRGIEVVAYDSEQTRGCRSTTSASTLCWTGTSPTSRARCSGS